MDNSKGASTIRNMYNGKHNSLPPKSPFPRITPFYTPNSAKYRDNNNSLHQRTSSESLLIEEQPSWLDELLDEPETPVKRGHRRSSSDSFTYMEAANANIQHAAQAEFRLRNMSSTWGSQDFDFYKQNSLIKSNNKGWDIQYSASSQEVNRIKLTTTTEKQDSVDNCTHNSSEKNDSGSTKASASETDTKRSKQQFAQRSRVRKLHYIAELEKNVQTLEADSCEVSGELKFLNQRSLILTMENKALKQRLENLAQEQLIKYLEHEVLEREIGRLRALYKQQQQQQPTTKDQPLISRIQSQFVNLTLKNKESAARDAVSGI